MVFFLFLVYLVEDKPEIKKLLKKIRKWPESEKKKIEMLTSFEGIFQNSSEKMYLNPFSKW